LIAGYAHKSAMGLRGTIIVGNEIVLDCRKRKLSVELKSNMGNMEEKRIEE
jgi:hypothetical protein